MTTATTNYSSIVQQKLSSYADDLETFARFYSAPRYRKGSTEALVSGMAVIAEEMKNIRSLRDPSAIRTKIREITARIDALLSGSTSTKQ